MPIQYRCKCGKTLEAADGTGGRRAKCPACGAIQAIPGAPREATHGIKLQPSETAMPPGHSPCPRCGKPIPTGAVHCRHCGFDAEAASMDEVPPPGSPPEDSEDEGRGGFSFPIKKVAVPAAAVAVLAAAWFFVIKPLISGMDFGKARSFLTNGDLDKAAAEYQKMLPKTSGADKELVELRLKQIELETQLNTAAVMSEGKNVVPGHLEMILYQGPPSGGALTFKVTFTNRGKEPIALKHDHFYLRGLSDLVLVAADHEDNKMEGVVAPGQSKDGLLAFRRLPNHPVDRKIGRRSEKSFFMMFNDGKNYVKWLLPY
jgi:hypothetical protein